MCAHWENKDIRADVGLFEEKIRGRIRRKVTDETFSIKCDNFSSIHLLPLIRARVVGEDILYEA